MRKLFFIFVCAVALQGRYAAGQVPLPFVKSQHTWELPNDKRYPGVKNFGIMTKSLWRGDQPTAEGFQQLEKAGVKTVISLRSDHDDFDLLRGTKLKYVRIPMHAWDPDQGDRAQLVLVLKTLRRLSTGLLTGPVYIHCAAGRDRTGFAVAAYLMTFEDWTADEAIHEMHDYHFNRIYLRNEPFLRRLDIQH